MKKETGNPEFPLWLLGDSNPKNWDKDIEYPLDSKHPARHNIWTSVLEVIQRNLYQKEKLNFDSISIYIRNAIEDPSDKPKSITANWNSIANDKINELKNLIVEYNPKIIFSFGAFAFEFARRVVDNEGNFKYGKWGAKELGEELLKRITNFNISKVNIFPLLHTSISRGFFLESHKYFTNSKTENYFEYAGNLISEIFLINKNKLNIWY